VLQVMEILPEHTKTLAEVKEQIVSSLKKEKAMAKAKEKADAAYAKVTAGAPLEEVAAADGLPVQTAEQFTLASFVQNVGREPRFVGAAFALKPGAVSKPVEGTSGYFLIELVEKNEINESDLASQQDNLRNQILARRKQAMFGQWYTTLKENAKIKDLRKEYL